MRTDKNKAFDFLQVKITIRFFKNFLPNSFRTTFFESYRIFFRKLGIAFYQMIGTPYIVIAVNKNLFNSLTISSSTSWEDVLKNISAALKFTYAPGVGDISRYHNRINVSIPKISECFFEQFVMILS